MLSIGRWPYSLALLTIKSITHAEVWPRNSYLTKAFKPGRSDLDLTIWFQEEPDPLELELLARRLRGLKRGLPFLGEIQVYFAPWAERFAATANRFEIMRDPQTQRRLHLASNLPIHVEKKVFLLRMLDSDAHNLQSRPKDRIPKWKAHFKSVGESWSTNEFLADPMQMILSRITDKPGVHAAQNYFQTRASRPDHEFAPNPWLSALFPQRFSFARYLPEKFLAPEITLGQISWEVWGLSSQIPLSPNPVAIREHLERMNILSLQAWRLAPAYAAEFAALGEKIDALKALTAFRSFEKTDVPLDPDRIQKSGTHPFDFQNERDSEESGEPTP